MQNKQEDSCQNVRTLYTARMILNLCIIRQLELILFKNRSALSHGGITCSTRMLLNKPQVSELNVRGLSFMCISLT